MRRVICLLACFTCTTEAQQSGWSWQNPLPVGGWLLSVHFPTQTLGFAAGDDGVILKSTDAGQTWNKVPTGTTSRLYDVHFVNERKGYAVGHNGFSTRTGIRTTDGGESWFPMSSGFPTFGGVLSAVHFSDSLTGMVVGDNSQGLAAGWRTTDGGVTWTTLTFPQFTQAFSDVHVISATNAVAVGFNDIVRTTDGGTTWSRQTSGTTNGLTGVAFATPDTGVTVGLTIIRRTTNGGATWSNVGGSGGSSVAFASSTTGWIAAANVMRKTTNGGATWVTQNVLSTMDLHGVSCPDPITAIGVGYYASGLSGSSIARTTNGGTNWIRVDSRVDDNDYYGLHFVDDNIGTVVGGLYANSILRTTNGGLQWTAQLSGVGGSVRLRGVYHFNASSAVTVGDAGTIRRTTNGGSNWISASSGTVNDLYSVDFASSTVGVAAGYGGTIVYTSNGGGTWVTRTSTTTSNLRSVNYGSSTRVMAVGEGGVILRSTDGGLTWSGLSSPTTLTLNGICLVDSLTAFAVGDVSIFKTTNGGDTWANVGPSNSQLLFGVHFLDVNMGTVVGQATILKTSDGGSTWTNHPAVTQYPLYAVYFTSPSHGTIVGQSSVILRTVSGGEVAVASATSMVTGPGLINFNAPGNNTSIQMNFTSVTGSGTVSVSRINTPPANPSFTGTPPVNVSQYRWVMTQSGLSSFSAEVRFNLSPFESGIPSPSTVDVYSRPISGTGSFSPLPTTYNTGSNELRVTVTSFSEFIFGSDNNPLTDVDIETIPRGFVLHQNYPNPFNPSTNFEFTIVDRQLTILKVYDLLGREVATLANEVKTPGSYKVTWNASGLSSGVYFYRLEAGSLSATRKLIILK